MIGQQHRAVGSSSRQLRLHCAARDGEGGRVLWCRSCGSTTSSREQQSGYQAGIECFHKNVLQYVPARGGRVKAQSEAAALLRNCSKLGRGEQKSEARKPKPEGNPKSEVRKEYLRSKRTGGRPSSGFGFRVSSLLRASAFGLRISTCHSRLAIHRHRRYIFSAGCGG